MSDLFQKVRAHQELQLPFVVFCKPNSEQIIGLFQNNDELYFVESFEEKGFVFAPFDSLKIPYIPQNQSEVCFEKVTTSDLYISNEKVFPINETAKKDFENLVQSGVDAIQSGNFQKVVLSRKEEIAVENFDIEIVFRKLIANYSMAFNYCFFHSKIGLWFGASPENFLKIHDTEIQTVALAGTQVFDKSENVFWENKEKEEQQFVTDFIVKNLKTYVSDVTVSQPYTAKAGNVLHLKTDISAILKTKENLKSIIETMHPTPAVCGLPKKDAKDFIIAHEGYDREYYAGFLGELNIDFATLRTEQSDLFVNLRCMKIVSDKALLFVGCGVTKDSNPNKEFQETVNKSMTMKKVL